MMDTTEQLLYRMKALPDQLDRARRRHDMLVREAVRLRRQDLLTPQEIEFASGVKA